MTVIQNIVFYEITEKASR